MPLAPSRLPAVAAPTIMPDSLADLLTVQHALQMQYDAVIDKQLNQLCGQVVDQIMQMRHLKPPLLQQRSQLLQQIRPFLAEDARWVLPTPEFRSFLEAFLFACQSSARVTEHPPTVSVDASA
ncbi:hypothetical protein IFO70_27675 [Phormidium tenue FACHB-886]|nr:hypothetical protein [Phormidium tenue FACHB-886]